jgi:hypothetical protein
MIINDGVIQRLPEVVTGPTLPHLLLFLKLDQHSNLLRKTYEAA